MATQSIKAVKPSDNKKHITNLGPSVAVNAQSEPSKASTQSKLGLTYVYGFLIIIGGVILITLWKCYQVTDIKDLLLAISGVLSGPLGFIIGFYFKEEIQNNKL